MLTEIGLGTWAIGGGDWGMGWGEQNEQDSIASILEALDRGINWIDTAHKWSDFKEILPKEAHLARRKTVEKLSYDQLHQQ